MPPPKTPPPPSFGPAPFDPAPYAMKIRAHRLKCLELAIQRAGADDRRPPLEIAEEFYGFVVNDPADKP